MTVREGLLILADGTTFEGELIGAERGERAPEERPALPGPSAALVAGIAAGGIAAYMALRSARRAPRPG